MKASNSILFLLVTKASSSFSYTFTIPSNLQHRASTRPHALFAFEPSKVMDDDGPTPKLDTETIEEVDPNTLPGLQYSKDSHPIPDQPWRRGDTDGCEDPIYADWRLEAEIIIEAACKSVGATLNGVTWGMSKCIVSLDDFSKVEGIIDGPEVVIDMREDYDEELGPDLTWNPTLSDEEFEEYIDTHPRSQVEALDDPMYEMKQSLDTSALSAVAGAIQTALEEPSVEERLRVVSRHEIILTQPFAPAGVLESQKDFDAHRGYDVAVETRDPYKSNRTIRGKLVSRTALDVIINVDGNMVTIPQNFVHKVSVEDATLQYEA